jgi:hypothetical protein
MPSATMATTVPTGRRRSPIRRTAPIRRRSVEMRPNGMP